MQIIPALYIKDHRFALFQPGNRSYVEPLAADPYELITQLGMLDVPRIHIIDQDTWTDTPSCNTGLIGSLSNMCQQKIEVGGGIRNMDALRRLIDAGLSYFVLGSALFDNFSFLVEIGKDIQCPNRNFLISIDVNQGASAAPGRASAEKTRTTQLIRRCIDLGFSRFIINDLNTFQLDDGPDVGFYRSLVEAFPAATFSAAGRIISLEHVEMLSKVGVAEVMVGNEIYLEDGLLEQISQFNHAQKVTRSMA